MTSNRRMLIFRLCAVVLLIVISVLMLIIGRAHTVYFDNKTVGYNGKEIPALYLISVEAKNNEIQEIYKRERCEISCMGQKLKIKMQIQDRKGQMDTRSETAVFKIPYGMDAVVVNLPAYLEGLPKDVWMTEFVSAAAEDGDSSNEVVLDEFGF